MRLIIKPFNYSMADITITEQQIAGILKSDKDSAIKLTGWEYIKNIFTKLFNCFPCISLFDKKQCLENLYEQVHDQARTQVTFYYPDINDEQTVNVMQFWALFEAFLTLLSQEEAQDFQYQIDTTLTPWGYEHRSPSLKISFQGTFVTEVKFSDHPQEIEHLCRLCECFLHQISLNSTQYVLDNDKFTPEQHKTTFSPTCRTSYYNEFFSVKS